MSLSQTLTSSAMASAMIYADIFSKIRFPTRFPAPRKIKSIVSFYNSSEAGTLKHYSYPFKKGDPRPWWTYRADRRNKSHGRSLLTKAI